MAEAKTVKLIFGETHPGSVRAMIGSEEVHGLVSVEMPKVKPGELPRIELVMLAPRLDIINKNPDDIAEMEEVTVPLTSKTSSKTISARAATSKKSSK